MDMIVTDIYPGDLNGSPNISALPGAVVSDKHVVGCYIKASEGVGWGTKNEAWFRKYWRELGDLCSRGKFHRGAYHFLRFSASGRDQALYFCDMIDSAGGISREFDMVPWVDVEIGGQGNWKQNSADVTRVTEDFVSTLRETVPGIRVAVYGRGIFRDLRMNRCRFGADVCVNPAYTSKMPLMDQYDWPLDDIIFWQLCGDGEVYAPGFPSEIPGWGKTDYSVFIDGPRNPDMSSFLSKAMAF